MKALTKSFWLSNLLLFSSEHWCIHVHSYTNAFTAQYQPLSKKYAAVLVNMSQELRQYCVAAGALGLYLLHEFMCHSGETDERGF